MWKADIRSQHHSHFSAVFISHKEVIFSFIQVTSGDPRTIQIFIRFMSVRQQKQQQWWLLNCAVQRNSWAQGHLTNIKKSLEDLGALASQSGMDGVLSGASTGDSNNSKKCKWSECGEESRNTGCGMAERCSLAVCKAVHKGRAQNLGSESSSTKLKED